MKEQAKKQIEEGGTGDYLENLLKSLNCDESDLKGGGDEKEPEKYSDYINFGKGLDQAISDYFD